MSRRATIPRKPSSPHLGSRLVAVGDGVDKRVKVEGGEVRVLCLDEDHGGVVVPGEVHVQGQAVVQVGEGDAILRPHRLPDDDLVNVIELIPVLLPGMEWSMNTPLQGQPLTPCHAPSPDELLVLDERLKLGSSWDGEVQSLGREEGLEVKEVEVVVINKVSKKLVAKAIESRQDLKSEVPAAICRAIHHPGSGGGTN